MLTGMWHGAAWNFIIWGLLYAVFLLLEKWIPWLKKMPAVLRHAYTLLIVMLGFVLFNAADLREALTDIGGLVGIGGVRLVSAETLYYLRSYAVVLVLGNVGATPLVKKAVVKLSEGKVTGRIIAIAEPVVLIALLALCTAYLVDGSFNPFLYFRF